MATPTVASGFSDGRDPTLGVSPSRQNHYAGLAKRFDFRGAIRSNARRTFYLLGGLTFCALLVGAAGGVAITGGRFLPIPIALCALGVGVVSLISAWFTLRSADGRIMEEQGGIEVSGNETGHMGVLARRLHNVTEEMSLASGVKMPRVFLIPEQGLNAFAVGRNPEVGAVAATQGLVETLNRDELQAVMAHEIGHIVQGDTRLMVTAAATAGIVLMAVDLLTRIVLNTGGRSSGSDSEGRKGSMLFALGALAVAWLIALVAIPVIKMALSRQREYMADANASKFTRNPAALASALDRISGNPHVSTANSATSGMYIASPLAPSFLSGLMATHPPMELRIARLMNMKAD